MSWPQVLGTFLTGTARGKSTEAEALNDAALAVAMRRAGYMPAVTGPDLVEPSPDDPLPPMEAGAELLRWCFDEDARLVVEWCEAAARAGWRIPDGRLPQTIEFLVKHPNLRQTAEPALGRRGIWLARLLHPDWLATVSAAPEPDEARRRWEEGSLAERKELLALLANRSRELARELVESTWKDEPAKVRTAFVETLAEAAGPHDEPFLTRCLGDRSLDVRYAAAKGLGRLSGCTVAEEMFQLAREFVDFGPPMKIQAPQMDDARFDRFGIASVKGPVRMDQRLSRLTRLVALIPPWRWELEGDSPANLVGRLDDDPKSRAVRDGLSSAAQGAGDVGWATALLEAERQSAGDPFSLVALLPRETQERLAIRVWESNAQIAPWRFVQFAITDRPWSAEFTRDFVEIVRSEMKAKRPRLAAYTVREAPFYMNPFAANPPQAEAPSEWASVLEYWHRILNLRRSMLSTLERSPKP